LPLVDDVPSLFSLSQCLLLFNKKNIFLKVLTRKNTTKTSVEKPISNWFEPAMLDVVSYDIELKMEIKS
jgi:hypothetical protein